MYYIMRVEFLSCFTDRHNKAMLDLFQQLPGECVQYESEDTSVKKGYICKVGPITKEILEALSIADCLYAEVLVDEE